MQIERRNGQNHLQVVKIKSTRTDTDIRRHRRRRRSLNGSSNGLRTRRDCRYTRCMVGRGNRAGSNNCVLGINKKHRTCGGSRGW
jgi:hypothetical protein